MRIEIGELIRIDRAPSQFHTFRYKGSPENVRRRGHDVYPTESLGLQARQLCVA